MTEAKNKDETKKEEQDEKPRKTLGLGTLSLKGGAPSAPRTGGPGSVAVEVRRKRVSPAQAKETTPQKPKEEDAHLTDQEREARVRALEAAANATQKKTSLPKRRVTLEDKKREEEKAAEEAKEAEKTAREKELEELKLIEEDERQKIAEAQAAAPPISSDPDAAPMLATRHHKHHNPDKPESETYRDKLKKAPAKPTRNTGTDRRGQRITVTQAINRDYERDRGPSLAAQRRAREKARLMAQGTKPEAQKILREVIVPEFITVAELANRMAEPNGDVIKTLMKLGVMATINQTIDADTAELVIDEMGHTIKRVTDADIEEGIEGTEDQEANLLPRPPVVTIMGHVDHGKTSLLDAMRETDVVSGEAGGITQHIGAYQVNMKDGQKITFLDTPGHAAFTEMRARGANVTDIVVIIVSAEDSVMPQTVEAISHAKAADVPIIIAVNKIDLPGADPQRVKTELLQHSVVVEELSGDVQCVEISAKKRINLDKLEEAIMLQAEMLEIKSNPNREAHGVVVESKQEKGRGSVATVLIQKGTLRVGDIFVAGAEFGKVRAIVDDRGKNIKEASPGQPVEVLGFNGTPESGDKFNVVGDETKAREVSEYRQRKSRESAAAAAVKGRATIEDLVALRETGEKTTLPVLIKGDVHGSVEAIAGSLQKMVEENEGIDVKVLHSGVGGITESDVTLAKASGGMIIGFNVRANAQARALANRDGVELRYYSVIYNVMDDAKSILTGMLSPSKREEYIGNAEILEVFNITKVGKVAGCKVTVGVVKRGSGVRLLRDDVVIHEGTLKTLKRHKDEVAEVKEGMECGMAFESYDDIKQGDVIECFEIIEEARVVS